MCACAHTHTPTHTHMQADTCIVSLSLSYTHTQRQTRHSHLLFEVQGRFTQASSQLLFLALQCLLQFAHLTLVHTTKQNSQHTARQNSQHTARQNGQHCVWYISLWYPQQDKRSTLCLVYLTLVPTTRQTVNIVSGISHSGTHNKTNGQHCVWYISLWYPQQDKRSTLCLVYLTLVPTTRQTVNIVSGIPHSGTHNKTKRSTLCLVYLTLVHTTRQNSQHTARQNSQHTRQNSQHTARQNSQHTRQNSQHTARQNSQHTRQNSQHTARQKGQHCVRYTSLWYIQ